MHYMYFYFLRSSVIDISFMAIKIPNVTLFRYNHVLSTLKIRYSQYTSICTITWNSAGNALADTPAARPVSSVILTQYFTRHKVQLLPASVYLYHLTNSLQQK